MSTPMSGRGTETDALVTEAWDPAAADLDLRSTAELVSLMNAEDELVPGAVRAASDDVAAAIDEVAARLIRGGRLVYVGAGTSGRLALVDASECETTFATTPGQVVAVIAGGDDASPLEQEAAEDDRAAGRHALAEIGVADPDAVVAISASGRTPFVLGALDAAQEAGALTVAVVSAPGSPLAQRCEHAIEVIVGPEVLAGSTRLKAGTAQKLVLNMISTISMIRLGKTFGNLMVDVVATNEKLRGRVESIVGRATGEDHDRVRATLELAGGDARVAIVALASGVDVDTARARLAAAGGVVRKALDA